MKIYGEQNKLVVTIEAHDTPENCAWLIDHMHFSKIFQEHDGLVFVSDARE